MCYLDMVKNKEFSCCIFNAKNQFGFIKTGIHVFIKTSRKRKHYDTTYFISDFLYFPSNILTNMVSHIEKT